MQSALCESENSANFRNFRIGGGFFHGVRGSLEDTTGAIGVLGLFAQAEKARLTPGFTPAGRDKMELKTL